jgi:flagellar biosynthesis protein FliR
MSPMLVPVALTVPSVPVEPAVALVVAGLAVRVAGLLLVGGQRLYPGLTPQVRLGLLLVVAVATAPTAIAASQSAVEPLPPLPLLFGSEFLVGAGLGIAVDLLVSAVAAAGAMLAATAGLDWAAAFTPGSEDRPGVARLCGWLGFAAFVSAGGQRLVVNGLLESCWRLPIGRLAGRFGDVELPLAEMLIELPSVGLSLAVSLALPVLVAVLTAHVTAAICLRTVSFTAGIGLLQGVAAVVLLGGLLLGSRQWSEQAGQLLVPPLEATFAAVAAPGPASPQRLQREEISP